MIGYARVSTREQDPAAQERELKAAGAERVFVDHGESSRVADRPHWVACKYYIRAGDTLVVRSLDRLAGTTTLAIQTITGLGERGINIKSLTEPDIDTTTPMGRALFGIVAVFAQLRDGHHQREHDARTGAGPGRGPSGWSPHRDDFGANRTSAPDARSKPQQSDSHPSTQSCAHA